MLYKTEKKKSQILLQRWKQFAFKFIRRVCPRPSIAIGIELGDHIKVILFKSILGMNVFDTIKTLQVRHGCVLVRLSCTSHYWLEWARFRTWGSIFMLMLLSHPQIYRTSVERCARKPSVVFRSTWRSLSSSSESPFRLWLVSSLEKQRFWWSFYSKRKFVRSQKRFNYKNFFDAHIQVILSELIHFLFSLACPLSFLPCLMILLHQTVVVKVATI